MHDAIAQPTGHLPMLLQHDLGQPILEIFEVAIFAQGRYNSSIYQVNKKNLDPRLLISGTQFDRCRCSLPGLTGFTANRRGRTDADELTLTVCINRRTKKNRKPKKIITTKTIVFLDYVFKTMFLKDFI